jgi:hypothetical protein
MFPAIGPADAQLPATSHTMRLPVLAFAVRRLLTRRGHMSESMKELFERFYSSIVHETPLPIPYREIIRTARIMDAIFAQVNAQADCVAK